MRYLTYALELVGFAAIVYGCYSLTQWLGYVVGGLVLLLVAQILPGEKE